MQGKTLSQLLCAPGAAAGKTSTPLPLKQVLAEAAAVDLADLRSGVAEVQRMVVLAKGELEKEKGEKRSSYRKVG